MTTRVEAKGKEHVFSTGERFDPSGIYWRGQSNENPVIAALERCVTSLTDGEESTRIYPFAAGIKMSGGEVDSVNVEASSYPYCISLKRGDSVTLYPQHGNSLEVKITRLD